MNLAAFKNAFYMLSEKIISMFCLLVASSFLARNFSQSDFGEYSYVVNLFQFFSFVALMGLETTAVRFFIERPRKTRLIMTSVLFLRFVGAILSIVFVVAYYVFSSDVSSLAVIYSLGYLIQAFYCVEFFYVSKNNLKSVFITKSAFIVLSVVIKLFLILYVKVDILWIVIIDIIYFSCVSSTYFFMSRRLFVLVHIRLLVDEMKGLLKPSYKIIISAFFIMIFTKSDQFMINHMAGLEENAIYAASNNIFMGLVILPSIISGAIYPYIVNASGRVGLNNPVREQLEVLSFMSIVVISFFFLFSDWVILLVYGDGFFESILVFKIQVLSLLFVSLGIGSNKWLIMHNMHGHLIFRAANGAVINVVLNYFLIPEHGAVGAAVASLVAHAVSGVFSNFISYKTKELFRIQLLSIIPVMISKRALYILRNRRAIF